MIDEDSVFDGQRLAEIFKDSLHGKRIESGHSIINFGKGGWNKNDIESLKSVLAKTTVQIDGKDASYRARSNMHVAHHRLFVEELLVRIREQ